MLAVLKMSFSDRDGSLREFTIASPDGLRVPAPFVSDVGVLDDLAEEDN